MSNKTGFQERPFAELAEHVAGKNHSCFLQYQLPVFAFLGVTPDRQVHHQRLDGQFEPAEEIPLPFAAGHLCQSTSRRSVSLKGRCYSAALGHRYTLGMGQFMWLAHRHGITHETSDMFGIL